MGSMIVCPSEQSCRFWIHPLLVVRNRRSERIATSLWSLFCSTSERLFASIGVFRIHFIFMREWMHSLGLNTCCSCVSFIALHAISSPEYLIRMRSRRRLICWVVLMAFDSTGLGIASWDQRLRSCCSRGCCLLGTQVEIVYDVCDVGDSVCFFLVHQLICKLGSSLVNHTFTRHSLWPYLPSRVSSVVLLQLLIHDRIVWRVDLELVCIVWWLRDFDILSLCLSFRC